MNYVYIQSERSGQKISENNYLEHNLWTVGFYTPGGKWEPESDHSTRDSAAARTLKLNGGDTETKTLHLIVDLTGIVDKLLDRVTELERKTKHLEQVVDRLREFSPSVE